MAKALWTALGVSSWLVWGLTGCDSAAPAERGPAPPAAGAVDGRAEDREGHFREENAPLRTLSADGVFDGSWVVTDEESLLEFVTVREITGDLTIQSTPLASLTLSQLERVGGRITLAQNDRLVSVALDALESAGAIASRNNPALTTLSMNALDGVDGDLELTHHSTLEAFEFPSLGFIAGELRLHSNASLSQIGFSALEHVGALDIANNATLESLFIPDLATVEHDLRIHDAITLKTVDLPALEQVGCAVRVDNVLELESVDLAALLWVGEGLVLHQLPSLDAVGFDELMAVGNGLVVIGCGVLEAFEAPQLGWVGGTVVFDQSLSMATLRLDALETIDGGLSLRHNASLTDLQLPSIDAIGCHVTIRNNEALPQCAIDEWIDELEASGGLGGEDRTGDNNTACECEKVGGVVEVDCQ